jgi:type VI secretion system secreted protein Hcp
VLALQRMAGNRAVAGLMRDVAVGGAVSTPHTRAPARLRVTITGHKQGRFKGSGANGSIEAWSFHLGVVSPRDRATGSASGARQYKQITFKKAFDAASPQLMTALSSNETLDQVRIEFLPSKEASAAGDSVVETIVLTNAAVASFDQDSDDDSDAVSLTFETIQMTNVPGATSASDTWRDRGQ